MSHRGVYPSQSPLAPRPSAKPAPGPDPSPIGTSRHVPMIVEARWSYGITTVPDRLDSLLPKTLASLASAGFDRPRLFVDGVSDCATCRRYRDLDLPLTARNTPMRIERSTYGNWVLALAELYARDPDCDRYALFQDDILSCRNLRAYLDTCPYPQDGYWNLYTFPVNYRMIRGNLGWSRSNQRGLGALGLVFDRQATIALLFNSHLIDRPYNQKDRRNRERRWRAVDGAIVTALKKAGRYEYVHNPSLLQHVGVQSALIQGRTPHPIADSFRGERFDALSILRGTR